VQSPGYFNNNEREYIITAMNPPRPWNNILWNEGLITVVDQFGFGGNYHCEGNGFVRSFCNKRLIYIRDEETKEFWDANRNSRRKKFSNFHATVGQGYSKISSEYKKIKFSLNIFVPKEGILECWAVDIENKGNKKRKLSVFAYADTNVNIGAHMAYNHGAFDKKLNGVFLSHHGFDLPTEFTNVFLASDKKVSAFETTNRRFIGFYGNTQEPDTLRAGDCSSKETSFDDQMTTVLQFKYELKPGEKKKIHFILGSSKSLKEATEICKTKLSEKFFNAELAKIRNYSENLLKKVNVETPDKDINTLVNIWLKRQIDLGKTWTAVVVKGFRDIMQQVAGFVPLDSKISKKTIKKCLEYQYEDGNVLRAWVPIIDHPYRDGATWMVPAIACYLKETGDFSFLEEKVKYYKSKKSGSVLDHCRRGFDFLFSELGKHGLCLWGGGDWNDSLNNVGLKLKGESVWLSEATVKSAKEFVELLEAIKKNKEAEKLSKKIELMEKALLKYGWDKDHFICGYNDWNEKIGSNKNKEGKLFLNMQTWGVLSGTVKGAKATKLLDLVEKELSCPFGYILEKPSYTKGDDHIGRVSYMEKGCYENGAVYNHGVTFKIASDCIMGRGNIAYKTIKKMLWTNPANPPLKSGSEPYVLTNMFIGPENVLRSGESLYNWTTSTGAWLFRDIVELMLGVRADYEGLRISPCLPSHWKDVKVVREYRGSCYNIRILNPKGLQTGALNVSVDNKKINSNLLPVFNDNKEHKVVVELR